MKTLAWMMLAGCGLAKPATYYSVNADGSRNPAYSRINEWSSYGRSGLGAQPVIARAYDDAEHAPAPSTPIQIFNSTLPAGVAVDGGIMTVDPQTRLEPVGKFELGYWVGDAPHEKDIEPDLHRLAQVVNGDVLVVTITHATHGDDRVQYVTGYVLRHPASARTVAPKPHAHLVYTATDGCPDETEFAARVTTRLGYSPWQAIGPELRAEVSRTAAGFVATVSLAGTRDDHAAARCTDAVDAAAATIATKLQPL